MIASVVSLVRGGQGNGRAALVAIIAAGVLMQIPFITKPFHVDSDMMVHTARQLLVNPVDPPLGQFGEHLVLHGHSGMSERSAYYRCMHPPLVQYLLAPVALVAGHREWPFHAVMLVFYAASVYSFWLLCGLFFSGNMRTFGTALWALCPALIVNSQNIMWDVAVVPFMLFSMYFLCAASRGNDTRRYVLSGVFTGLAMLTKVNAAPLYIVAGVAIVSSRRWKAGVLWAIPALTLPAAWVVHNLVVFEQIQYLSTGQTNVILGDVRYRIERIISYAGGCIFLPLWWLWAISMNRKRVTLYLTGLIPVIAWGIALSVFLHTSAAFSAAYVVFASTGLWALASMVFGRQRYGNGAVSDMRVVKLFSVLYSVSMVFAPTANVRYMLPVVAMLILGVMSLAASFPLMHRRVFGVSSLASAVFLSAVLSHADYLACDADRRLPALLKERNYQPGNTWFFARCALGYYLYYAGYSELKRSTRSVVPGDYLIYEKTPGDYRVYENVGPGLKAVAVDSMALYRFPFFTIGNSGGFYGTTRLPYSFSLSGYQKEIVMYQVR
jgi:hypothetical protein